ncbi:MAG: ectoine utilization protein EutA, partial [Pseudomonadota bacterium]
ADAREAEALVLSCTDMRSVEAAAALEARTGKPVITSNGAMMDAALTHLAGSARLGA